MRFSQSVGDLLRRYSGVTGLAPLRASEPEELTRLIQSLHPVSTEHELIRLGGTGDGGYLVPNDLQGIKHVFSPGVADSWTFEEEIYAKTGVQMHLIDPAPVSRTCPFPVVQASLSPFGGPGLIAVNDWVKSKTGSAEGDWLMQMDIEGHEYRVLVALEDSLLKRFRILIVEFHRLDLVLSKDWLNFVVQPIMTRLLRDYFIVHVHENPVGRKMHVGKEEINELLEVTFLRKDRVHGQ